VNVLVTGGTGTLGRVLVMQLRQSGHRARILSRQPRGHVDAVQGDLSSGAGLFKAVAGMDSIIHAASATREPLRGHVVDVVGTRRLLAMAREANIAHVVYVSIVGVDRSSYPYHRTKLAAEAVVRENLVPWSIVRATQFHPFIDLVMGAFSRVPRVTMVPYMWQVQPVHVDEVARRVTEAVLQPPTSAIEDFGGPEVLTFKAVAEAWIAARRLDKRLVNLWLPLKFSRETAQGSLTCPGHKDGAITWSQYLADRYPQQ
jgi:uncharacterized protein YbjT (DUF2867 family)